MTKFPSAWGSAKSPVCFWACDIPCQNPSSLLLCSSCSPQEMFPRTCLTTLFAGPKAPCHLFLWHGVHVPTDDPVPHSDPFRCYHLVPPSFFHKNNTIITMETLARSLEFLQPPRQSKSQASYRKPAISATNCVSLTPISVMHPHLILSLKLPDVIPKWRL